MQMMIYTKEFLESLDPQGRALKMREFFIIDRKIKVYNIEHHAAFLCEIISPSSFRVESVASGERKSFPISALSYSGPSAVGLKIADTLIDIESSKFEIGSVQAIQDIALYLKLTGRLDDIAKEMSDSQKAQNRLDVLGKALAMRSANIETFTADDGDSASYEMEFSSFDPRYSVTGSSIEELADNLEAVMFPSS